MSSNTIQLATIFATGNIVLSEIRDSVKNDNMKDLFELFVAGIIESDYLKALTKLQKLGVATVIIGAAKVDHFYLAFKILWYVVRLFN